MTREPVSVPSWRQSIKLTVGTNDNAARQRKAFKQLTECELMTGKTVQQLDAEMAAQRARVLARYGVKAA